MTTTPGNHTRHKTILGWIVPIGLALLTAWVAFRSAPPARPAPTSTNAPPVTIIYVTVTSTPTARPLPSATYTPRATNTPRATAWPSPTPRGTATPYMTATAYPSPTQFVRPNVPAADVMLALHTPSVTELHRALTLYLSDHNRLEYYDDWTSTRDLVQTVTDWAFSQATANDLDRYYSAGLPSNSPALTFDMAWTYYRSLPTGATAYQLALAAGYVRDHPAVLADGESFVIGQLHGIPHEIQVDSDAEFEWVIEIYDPNTSLINWLMADKKATGAWQVTDTYWYMSNLALDDLPEVDLTYDLTGDGRAEAILSAEYYLSGSPWGVVRIYHWQADHWKEIGSITREETARRSGELVPVTIEADPADGTFELQMITAHNVGFGCGYQITTIYQWDGQTLAAHSQGAPAASGNCRLGLAKREFDPSARLHQFERAVRQLAAEKADPDQLAWARVQLAMGYAGQGELEQATTLLQTAAAAEGDTRFLALLRQAVAEAGPAPYPVCVWLDQAARVLGDSAKLGSSISDDLIYDLNWGHEIAPELVCPLRTLTNQLLAQAQPAVTLQPGEALATLGIQSENWRALNLDGDAEAEWVGYLPGTLGFTVIFDWDRAIWQVGYVETNDLGQTTVAAYWPAAATTADLLLASTPITAAAQGCLSGYVNLQLRQLTQVAGEWQPAGYWNDCGDPALLNLSDPAVQATVAFRLKEAAAESGPATVEPRPAWFMLSNYPGDAQTNGNLMDYVDRLQNNVLSGNYPIGTQQAITDLLAYLPNDEPAAQPVIDELLYLRGLSYELAGDASNAVAAYAELIERAPDSLWAWLAWARVGPE